MLKVKKMFSTFVGMAMTVNALMTMPFSAFADEETSHTYTYDGYEVSYDVTNAWGNTEVVSVTLSNTGDSTIENWMLYFEPNGQVHNTVNVQEAQTSAGTTYFRNSGYNANINPDSSVSFCYMVDDCEAVPDNFTLCQTREEKESGYEVSLKVNQTWGDSFNGEIIIQNNTDKPIESWELTVDTNFTITEITNSWAATVKELEPYSYMLKGTYTGTVYPNSSVSLGFNGVKSGEPTITDYSLTEVVADEKAISSSELNNAPIYDNYINNKINAEALYDSENENIDISWTAETIGSSFEVYVSDDNDEYELYETVDGNTFNSVYHITGDFIIKYFKIKQTLDDGNIIYSNICYAVYAPVGTEWTEYLRDWEIPTDDEILSEINNEDSLYKLSLEFNAAGVPDIHLNVSESTYTNAIKNNYILGAAPEIFYKDELLTKDITIKFQIKENFLSNELGTLGNNPEFTNIKRFNIFKYFEDINMLLPVETKFDLSNNIVYTEVEELGTYCVVDMEKWLDSLDVDAEIISNASLNSSAGISLFSELTDTATDAFISDELISENTSGGSMIVSSEADAPNNIQAILNNNNFSDIATKVSDDPVDIVFVLQCAGEYESNYLAERQMILDASENIFKTYTNAHIYVIGFKHNEAYFLKENESNADYFSSREEMECLYNYEHDQFEGYVNRTPAYELLRDHVQFRNDSKNFVFTLLNGSTDCQGIDQTDICNEPNMNINYSEVLCGVVYLGAESTVSVLDAVIKKNGICIIYDENSAGVIYEHICDNMKLEVPEGFENKIYMGMDWSEMNLSSPLQVNGKTDTDHDDLTDWEEVNSEFLEKNGIILNDNEYIKDIEDKLPSAWYMLKSEYNFVPFRFVNSNNFGLYNILNKIKVLPVKSNPLKASSADDGVSDLDKLKPEKMFNNNISKFYDENDRYYNYYNDSKYYTDHLEKRYTDKGAFKAYTVESIFTELKDPTINSTSNSVYIKAEGNEITICPNIYFTGDYNANAIDYLKTENEDSKRLYEELKNKYGDNVTLDKVFLDGLKNRWEKEFNGTIFDFYPGMKIKTKVEFKLYEQEPQNQNYINVNLNTKGGIAITEMGGVFRNNKIELYIGEGTGYSIDVFEGVCAHEFGHTLNITDAYPGMNNNFTSAYSDNQLNELYYNKGIYGSVGGGEIMRANSDVLPNDIEMALYGVIENENQHFTPTYYNKYDCKVSSAIRAKHLYKYVPDVEKPEHDMVYKEGEYYKWVDGKGYIPAEANIQTGNIDGVDLQYYEETYDGETTVTIYGLFKNSYSGKVTIPAEINGHKVTKICDGAFRDSQISLIEFGAPDNIYYIGISAFHNCVNLEKIDIPNIKYIFANTFENCINLSEVNIPQGVIKIQNSAFKNCGLISVILPKGMKNIESNAFSDCPYMKSVTIPEGVEEIGWAAFAATALESVYIPSSVKRIETYAFNECRKLKNVTISEGVEVIGNAAFAATALESVNIPSSVKIIETHAFNGCRLLKNVVISEGVMYFGVSVFESTALEEVVLPSSVQYISDLVFYNCIKLKKVTFKSNNLVYYGDWVFLSCNNIEVFVPSESVDFYSNWLSQYSNITIYEINNEVK